MDNIKSGAQQDVISTSQDSGEMINAAIKVNETSKLDMLQNIPMPISNIILGNIVEKKFDIGKYEFDDDHVSTASELGFPQVFISDNTTFPEKKISKHSLFGQKVLASKSARHNSLDICKDKFSHCNKETSILSEGQLATKIHLINLDNLIKISKADILKEKKKVDKLFNSIELKYNKETSNLTEEQLASEINRENLEKLTKMSEAEILEEKRKLEKTLNPEVLASKSARHNSLDICKGKFSHSNKKTSILPEEQLASKIDWKTSGQLIEISEADILKERKKLDKIFNSMELKYYKEVTTSNLTEEQLASEINRENLGKLAMMSEAEILEEKRKLEKTLNPELIQFLKNRKSRISGKRQFAQDNIRYNVSDTNKAPMDTKIFSDKKMKFSLNDNNTEMHCTKDTINILDTTDTSSNIEISDDKKTKFLSSDNDMKMDCKDNTLSIPLSSKKLLEESKQKGWLHMNTPEPEKMEWMKDLSGEKKDGSPPNEEYNARFDFNGLLLPYKDESLTVEKGLHHHGEEPERPGYSLQELLQLSRSSTQQQRCTALKTMANIMEKTHKGWYDKTLHPAPLTALSQKNILLLLRFSLDDPSVAVVTASLQALRAFLVSEADEVCLDRLFGFDEYTEPILAPQLEDKDTSSLKDHELSQVDAVAALLRSDILLRIRYILSEVRPSSIGVICALDILIRLARHSHEAALNISSTPHLLDIIIQNFIPLSLDRAMQEDVDNVYGIPLAKAIKLCRVLVTYGRKPVAQKLDNLKIIQTIITYASSDMGSSSKTDDMCRSIENLRLWQMLLYHEIGLDSVAGTQLTLMAQLKLWLDYFDIEHSSELDCERAVALITVANHERMLHAIIESLSEKWNRQFLLILKPTWGMMKLRAVVLSIHKNLIEISTFKRGISRFWLSEQHIFSTLCSNSNLLSDCNLVIDREPSCLRNLGVLMENGEMQPIVSVNSCIPFLSMMMNIFCFKLDNINIRTIFESPKILKYLQNLETTKWNLERSWYSRTELYFLTALVKAASLTSDLPDEQKETVWKIAVKLVSALPADNTDDVKNILEIALFNKRAYMSIAVLGMFELNLESMLDQFKVSEQGTHSDAVLLYEKYVPAKGNWDQAAMPRDWLFLPLVHVYTKCKNDVKLEPEDKNSVLIVLKVALFLPDLMETLSPTLRFSRLTLVYLCDTLYLDEDMSFLLSKVQSNLLKTYHTELNFQTELPGLTSFIDLFTALCEHFCANSYGNDNFAITLLVPMAQRHDAHYRKLLWSEHAAALRYLRLPLEKLTKLLPLTEYLYPEEEDTSLIDSYITALVRGTITETWCPIPFAIALHHAAMYLRRTSKLAVRMRTQVEKLRNRDIADKLLSYEPSRL